jgi:hypothetical protein
MTPPLVASYWPNGPTFAVPRNWSNAVLPKGSNSVSMQDAIGGSSKKENDGTDNHWIKIHQMTVALPANPNPAGCGALHYR